MEVRTRLVRTFLEDTSEWLRVEDVDVQTCITSNHACDALIAALVARASALSLAEPIPKEDRESAKREGWIAVPTEGSLGMLAVT